MLRRLIGVSFVWLALIALAPSADAQGLQRLCFPTATGNCQQVTAANPFPVSATVNASVGGFNWETNLTPFTATTSSVTSGSFTAGKTVIVSNAGATITAYCKLGATATSGALPVLPGQSIGFTSVSETTVACITPSSTTTINVQVGTGLPTGWGGSGAGGGGAVTIADGADVNAGATTDAATTAGGAGTLAAKMRLMTSQLSTISSNTGGAVPAGTNNIGGVRPWFGAAQLSHQVASFSSSGNNTVVTRAVGTIKVYGLLLSCASSVATMIMQDGTSTSLGANQVVTSIFLPVQSEPYYTTTGTNNFVVNLSSGISCTGWVKYLDS